MFYTGDTKSAASPYRLVIFKTKQHKTTHFEVIHHSILLINIKNEPVSYLQCLLTSYVQNVHCPIISSNVNNVFLQIFATECPFLFSLVYKKYKNHSINTRFIVENKVAPFVSLTTYTWRISYEKGRP